MFKFSMNWLKKYCGEIPSDEVFSILNLQGFEFQGSQNVNGDLVTAIEVKADRPDMLCHMGIAREINAYKCDKLPLVPKSNFKVDSSKFSVKIEDKTACKRFSMLRLKNINNTVKTPEYIQSCLESMGVNLVNPVVDIINYVMFDIGQPMHCYDAKKLQNESLCISRAKNDFKIATLGDEAEVKKGDILISSGENVACVAGIIGADFSSVTEESKEILLEAAVFDEVSIRLTSRRMKISTPSSFRFERGVDIQKSFDALSYCAKLITDICGGEICSEAFDYYPEAVNPTKIELSLKNTNRLLGTNLKIDEVKKCLEKYSFKCEDINEEKILVTVPSYRITVKLEVDLIGEVAKIYGYNNIPETMPISCVSYKRNDVLSVKDKLRNLLLSLGFCETINYSFIPQNTMQSIGVKPTDMVYGDVMLQNPISLAYCLMRPTLVYSLVNCLAYNYSIKNTDIALFELGKTYFKDASYDTGCKEIETCGFIMTGIRSEKGWGQAKDLKYDYYDLLSYLDAVMDSFGGKYELKKVDFEFCKKKTSYEIFIGGEKVGFIGQIDKSKFDIVKNLKLVRDDIFYCEIYNEKLSQKDKKISFESKYPPVKRLYNLVHLKSVSSKDIMDTIRSSSDIVRQICVKDIYKDKNMPEDSHAVLYEVNYCSKDSTLTLEEIEKIEKQFIGVLSDKFGVALKA